ncbi:2OG-Fe(II) oxygenase [Labrys portucalensis]|uniref:2OG-Fe(II) oxygenase n=1 Tax=Labrys neptuniae TaxID=376174 RepID=A0ABV6ZB06_9HYPH|nr:2OG-Fe(II) oxygenase [Labrys neptuniae]MDT3379392.1 2OG-Fe(II) oxygenase [Labrys neptuniae]
MPVIDLDVIRNAEIHDEPYRHIIGEGFLQKNKIPSLRQDFPAIDKPGFLTVSDIALRGSFRELVEELESSAMAQSLSEKLGLDLDPLPRLTTIRRLSQLKDGRIHTDSESKLATFLVYMNDGWKEGEGGCLRVLNGPDDFDDMTAEISPVMGSCFGFRRAANSWHGHKPFAGERRVVQITWLKDAGELERKKKRNSVAQFFKGIFGR